MFFFHLLLNEILKLDLVKQLQDVFGFTMIN